MMQKIQKFGGAMFTPVLLFAFAGITIGVGTLFTTEAIMGSLASPENMWFKCWNVVLQGGWTVFNQLPLLFVVGLPIGMAKKQNARCCMEALVLYLTFHYFLNTILSQWGGTFGVDFSAEIGGTSGLTMIANIKTLDMGMIGALVISGIVIYLHNRFFDTELPDWLGTFSGSTFVFMVGFFVMIPVAFLAALIWPKIQVAMLVFQGFVKSSGAVGVGVFVFLERILIPFGLHHILYSPFFYDNVVVPGGIYSYWATKLPEIAASTDSLKTLLPEAAFTSTGYSKIFGCPGIALAFYATAKPEKKKQVLGLLIPITLTAIFCGVTEPIEFTFLFVAPLLFLVHAFLDACLQTISFALGVVGDFGGGIINWVVLNWLPLGMYHWKVYVVQVVVGVIFSFIWFFVFTFLIKKFDMKTPGREEDSEETKLYTKNEYLETKDEKGNKLSKASQQASEYIKLVGGAENVVDVTNCATRLRLTLKDDSIISKEEDFKAVGAHGLVHNGKAIQIIIGLSVPSVREEFENLL